MRTVILPSSCAYFNSCHHLPPTVVNCKCHRSHSNASTLGKDIGSPHGEYSNSFNLASSSVHQLCTASKILSCRNSCIGVNLQFIRHKKNKSIIFLFRIHGNTVKGNPALHRLHNAPSTSAYLLQQILVLLNALILSESLVDERDVHQHKSFCILPLLSEIRI